jgi:hypothetical protein
LGQGFNDSTGLLAKDGQQRDLKASSLDEFAKTDLMQVVVNILAERLDNSVPTPAPARVNAGKTEPARSLRIKVVTLGKARSKHGWKTPGEIIGCKTMARAVGENAES